MDDVSSPIEDRTFQTALRATMAVVLVGAVIFLVYKAWGVIQPLIVAIFISTALWQWVTRIASVPIGPRRWRMPRFVAATLIYLFTSIAAALVIWTVVSQLLQGVEVLARAFPDQAKTLQDFVQSFETGNIAGAAGTLIEDLTGQDTGAAGPEGQVADNGALRNAWAVAVGVLGGLANIGLTLVFTFFLLLEGNRASQWALMAFPRDRRLHFRALGERIRDRIGNWTLATFLYSSTGFIIVGAVMWALQVPSPWLYAIGGFALAAFPGIGPALTAIPAFFVVVGASSWQPIAVAVFGIVYFIVDGMVISPRIYGAVMRLPSFIVLVAVLTGGALMGVWGALIAPLVAVTAEAVLRDMTGREL